MIITEVFLVKPSFNIVRSGVVSFENGTLKWAGDSGFNWSSRQYGTASQSGHFSHQVDIVYSSAASQRWIGFPLRCLAN